ncbi:DNA-binding SARP family transcriptional activator [Saccharothrix saharensis]|uniref:DNA-binding SARP family transcriptional activator n=1 Tax=Saccharothrix saharensis TaxID=571190 RepID=A0A543JQU4_9PSEU|nr:AfsR/SARP family transcriptional regulator [Saccharothrix saharensis]TQM85188.1 DNA-binding SARP family transcriptional activator [Saccharothrix saharensis]
MDFEVLGPIKVHHKGVVYLPSAPKLRQLLALFLLKANMFVSVHDCVEELWEDRPPRTVIPTLQTYVLHLRRTLAASPAVGTLDAARRVLVTGRGGYYLTLPTEALDLARFERWLRQGRDAQRCGNPVEASANFRKALDVWRGPALSDVQAGPLLLPMISALNEARIAATEQFFDAELRLGYHRDILSHVYSVAAEHPLNEKVQYQYMLALYRSGRQVQALQVYQRLREVLTSELGLEPSPAVQQLHQSILERDPLLDDSAA